ncbi:hypothetical protein MTX26_18970 [Bradyrhizobium sp. ISRA443]|uniref:hypothetical protein n=1 Tax=unclassified Bradyrhizobium TaxID=2631580 RepID=UPI0024799A9D|nr:MULTISPECIES: hypothetical protein [unclassified Bradyrhizobium]WGR92246.1 hypothetical protein MTX20_29635 [Bradyrhizobium sp. ISRA435]WGR96550.1 hypothetical protein MTX23_18970 [Bradyrhizobium sp. ISRA436]WGS03437.1 hypothetical protein MTX18_18970 [Bradyrhizobium sp. ISRA437]WGS10321.1 hypothetical protein MTX26_18970 [Bradyrhizobium sp. ISRA443]
MRKTVLSMALLVAVGAPQALAQQGGVTTMQKDRPLPQAPVGHRQPRASDVPSEKHLSDPNSQTSKEDAALDKKIKSICRGC